MISTYLVALAGSWAVQDTVRGGVVIEGGVVW